MVAAGISAGLLVHSCVEPMSRAVLASGSRARDRGPAGVGRVGSPVKCAHRFVPSRPPSPAHSSHVSSAADPAPSVRPSARRRRAAAAIFLRLVASLDCASGPARRLTGARVFVPVALCYQLRDAPADLSRVATRSGTRRHCSGAASS